MASSKKNKLRIADRHRLLTFALHRFQDVKLREKEEKARMKLIDLFLADYSREIEPYLATSAKAAGFAKMNKITLPSVTYVAEEVKSHTLPNGKVVKRASVATSIDMKGLRVEVGNHYWRSAADIDLDYQYGIRGFHLIDDPHRFELKLEKDIWLPGSSFSLGRDKASSSPDYTIGYRFNKQDTTVFYDDGFNFSAATVKAHREYILALNARLQSEYELLIAIKALIDNCDVFDDLVLLWPEAEDMRTALYPPSPVIAASAALVTLNDEMKEKLCANMSARGIKGSQVCAVTPKKVSKAAKRGAAQPTKLSVVRNAA